MKIFASCVAFDEGRSGISDYMASTLRVLQRDHELSVLIQRKDHAKFPLKDGRISFIYPPQWTDKPQFSIFWHLYLLPLFVNLKRFDMVFLPAGNRRLLAHYPPNTVVTFHDLALFHVKGRIDVYHKLFVKHIAPHYLRDMPTIFAISENTKNDLIRYYGLAPGRIRVNYNGFDSSKLDNPISKEALHAKLGSTKPYMLYISRIEHPVKNHVNLLKAYELLPQELRDEYDLVCAGAPAGGAEKVFDRHKKLSNPANVHFPGFVEDREMAALYKHASLYVFPSLYEGFGIPILEAFASQLPVICSDRSSLPEIGGTAVLSFNPEKPASIAMRMQQLLIDPHLRNELIRRGLERLHSFSWESHVKKILKAVNKPSK